MKPNDTPEMEVCRSGDLTDKLRRQLEEWTRAIFGDAELEHEWAAPHWHLLVRCQGVLACHLAITERVARAGGRPVRVAGIGGVMTPPEWRGRGLARAAMNEAAAFISTDLRAEFGFLLCSESLVRFYRGLGWERLSETVRYDQSGGKEDWAEEAMILPCTDRAWPKGAVDLCGPPW
jgi:aminoglycoside 2'-N-acetyltransferase I